MPDPDFFLFLSPRHKHQLFMTSYTRLLQYLFSIIILIFSLPNLMAQESKEGKSEYLPVLDGILKTKVEYDLDNLLTRFEVRNARFGVRGKINPYFSYRVQIDLSDEGVIKMLDAYARFTPVKNLDFYLGQKKIPFSTDYMRSPADLFFANRSFIAKYINSGLRDIGLYVNYITSGIIPLDIYAGLVNGTGNNNPEWVETPNVVGRIAAGDEDGIRITGNSYFGRSQGKDKLVMLGGEIRYSRGYFFIESEYVQQRYSDTMSIRQHNDAIHIHSYYNFPLKHKMITMLTPVARWDIIGNEVFKGKQDADRITAGLNIGFEPKQFVAEIRLNYENYFRSSLPIHTDKITLEFVAKF